MSKYHRPVLLGETIGGLCIKPHGVYLDCTVGGGGHSRAILEADPTVRLIAIDKDGEAIEEAGARLAPYSNRVTLHRSDYKNFRTVLEEEGVRELDGFLVDLGISSHQIDDADRGFSYRLPDAPLDMRMDKRSALTAEDVVNTYSQEQLVRIFREYGEESFSVRIARRIVHAREEERIRTAGKLAALVEGEYPPKLRSPACARKVFQAIRIEVNGELEGLYDCITGLIGTLKHGGRGCVITFHSLEDRIVKQAFKDLNTACTCPPGFPVCVCGKKKEIEIVTKKPITATEEELSENSRSKSAKLRIAEKI